MSLISKAERRKEATRKISSLEYINGLKPNPIDVTGSVLSNGSPGTQDTECSGYRACLSISAYADWARFACINCPVYQERQRQLGRTDTACVH